MPAIPVPAAAASGPGRHRLRPGGPRDRTGGTRRRPAASWRKDQTSSSSRPAAPAMTAHSTPVHQRPAVAAAMATRNHSTPTRTRGPAMSGRTMNRPRPDRPAGTVPGRLVRHRCPTGRPGRTGSALGPGLRPGRAFALPVLALAVLALAVLALRGLGPGPGRGARGPLRGLGPGHPSACSRWCCRWPSRQFPPETGGRHRDLVGIADRGVALGRLAVDPDATDGEDLGEAVAEARRGPRGPRRPWNPRSRRSTCRRPPGPGRTDARLAPQEVTPGRPRRRRAPLPPGPGRPRRPPPGAAAGVPCGAVTHLLVVRHGQSEWNADGRWQGQENPPLTDLGREQARQAARAVGRGGRRLRQSPRPCRHHRGDHQRGAGCRAGDHPAGPDGAPRRASGRASPAPTSRRTSRATWPTADGRRGGRTTSRWRSGSWPPST